MFNVFCFNKYQLNTEHTSLVLCLLCVFQAGVKTENTVRIQLIIEIKLELSLHTFDSKLSFHRVDVHGHK